MHNSNRNGYVKKIHHFKGKVFSIWVAINSLEFPISTESDFVGLVVDLIFENMIVLLMIW